ncbi:hypothetical protein Ancab_008067 [Ancistrocladus abbreviatus]
MLSGVGFVPPLELDSMWDSIDESLSKDGKASYLVPSQKCLFNFLSKSIADTAGSLQIAGSGYFMLVDKWLALQLMPTTYIGALQPLVEIFPPLLFVSFCSQSR